MPSCLRYAGKVFLFGAALLMIISFSTPNWIAGIAKRPPKRQLRYGLWQSCIDIQCFSLFADKEGMVHAMGDWLYLAEALCALGVINCSLAAIISIIMLVYDECRNSHNTIGAITLLVFVSCLTYSGGIATYGIKSDEKSPYALKRPMTFGFSFYMGVASCLTMCVSSLFFVLEYRHLTATRIKYRPINV